MRRVPRPQTWPPMREESLFQQVWQCHRKHAWRMLFIRLHECAGFSGWWWSDSEVRTWISTSWCYVINPWVRAVQHMAMAEMHNHRTGRLGKHDSGNNMHSSIFRNCFVWFFFQFNSFLHLNFSSEKWWSKLQSCNHMIYWYFKSSI